MFQGPPGWHTLPPTLNFDNPGAGLPFPQLPLPVLSNHFGYLIIFIYFLWGLLVAALGSPALPYPFPSHFCSHDSWSCPLWTLACVPACGYVLPHVYKILHHTQERSHPLSSTIPRRGCIFSSLYYSLTVSYFENKPDSNTQCSFPFYTPYGNVICFLSYLTNPLAH